MPLPLKPQTASVSAVSATEVSGEITTYAYGAATNIGCHLTEKTSQYAVESWGIDTEYPAVLLVDLSDAGSIKVGDRLTVNSRLYIVLAGPQKMDAESITAHARYLVQRFE